MKNIYYYFLLLISNTSFIYAQDISESPSEIQMSQEIEPEIESTTTNPSTSFSDENLPNPDISTEEVAILEPQSFTSQFVSPNELIPPKDIEASVLKVDTPRKSTLLAVSLSCLIPGLGHAYLGDYATASSIFGSSAIGIGAQFNNHTAYPGVLTLEIAMFYGIYAAYRDVRLYNNNFGCSYKMPTDSFKELSLAPFNLRILKKPEVWGGLLGSLAMAGGIIYLKNKLDIHTHCKISSKNAKPFAAFAVGLSEETFFRGYLQSAFSETFTPIGGIILSSLLFGAAHIPNASLLSHKDRKNYYAFSLPFITSAGAYFGWMTYKNHSLQESVALHSWYDFILFSIGRALTHSAMIGKPNFAFSFSF